jgi:beta-lactamase regulating signal transducer with metallopeptidase domain
VEEERMLEHVTRALYYFEVHLLYASLVWSAALVLTSIPRGSATTKYWIWVAAALNFIFPIGAFFDRFWTSHLSWATPLGVVGGTAAQITRSPAAGVLSVVWLLGATLMFSRLCLRIRAERGDARAMAGQNYRETKWSFYARGVPVRFAASCHAPAVDGVLHPYISLPCGIDEVLSENELNAVLIHEFTHARRRDNLIRLIHELGLCVLWFHPLVWITGSRLALYRELSCDEFVIQSAHGGDLVSALAKLANPEETFLLQATASSFISRRLARLTATQPHRTCLAANTVLAAVFGGVLLAGVLGTVAHTACCFLAGSQSSRRSYVQTDQAAGGTILDSAFNLAAGGPILPSSNSSESRPAARPANRECPFARGRAH